MKLFQYSTGPHSQLLEYVCSIGYRSSYIRDDVRTMAGLSFLLFGPSLFQNLRVGSGDTLIGFTSLTFGLVETVLLWRHDGGLRKHKTYCSG